MHTQRGRDGGESVVFTFILQVSVGDEGGEKKNGEGNNVFIMFLMCLRILLFSISEHQLLLPAGREGRGLGGPGHRSPAKLI